MTAPQIVQAVAAAYGILPDTIRRKGNHRPVVDARHVAIWFIRKRLAWSFPQIGQYLGGRHHTTALHSYRKIEAELQRSDVRGMIEAIGAKLPAYTPIVYRPGRLYVPVERGAA